MENPQRILFILKILKKGEIYIRKKINNTNTLEIVKILDLYKSNKKHIQSRKITNKLIINNSKSEKLMIIDYYRKNGDIYFIGRFMNTGFINSNIHYSQLKTGEIKDLLYPSVLGIGYLGNDFHLIIKDKQLHRVLYMKWRNMINRCYNKTHKQYKIYGGSGITVSPRWHCYCNYFYDVQKLENYDRGKVINGILTLDKDLKQLNKSKYDMEYSKKSCIWLTVKEQNKIVNHDLAQDSLKKFFIAIDPEGNEIKYKGIGKFARLHNLDPGDCSRALNGKVPHVKGYKFKKYEE